MATPARTDTAIRMEAWDPMRQWIQRNKRWPKHNQGNSEADQTENALAERWQVNKDKIAADVKRELQGICDTPSISTLQASVTTSSGQSASGAAQPTKAIKYFKDNYTYFTTFCKFPETMTVTDNQAMKKAFLDMPAVKRVSDVLLKNRELSFMIVGGAVRDLLQNSSAHIKDVDIQVALEVEGDDPIDKIDNFKKTMKDIMISNGYQKQEVKVDKLAVIIGEPTRVLDGIDILLAQSQYSAADAENDVNSLMFDLDKGLLLDPFGTGVANTRKSQFRIVADVNEWYAHKIPSRRHNGRWPRLLKMLQKGFGFADPEQRQAFIKLGNSQWHNLADRESGAGLFSVLTIVLGMNVRGDRLDFKTGEIKASTDPEKIQKFDECMRKLRFLDSDLHDKVLKHLNDEANRHENADENPGEEKCDEHADEPVLDATPNLDDFGPKPLLGERWG